MKGIIGTHMKYKGFIVPRGGKLSHLSQSVISFEARIRLSWMDYYQKTGNGRLTCRHFGLSPDTFYKWKRKYQKDNLKSLEDDRKSRRPSILRHPETPIEVVEKIKSLRETYPRWGKEKLFILLKKELIKEGKESLLVSVSTVGRTIERLKQRGILKEPIPNYISCKKRFLKRAWAVRKPKDYEVKEFGDLVEVDTLDIRPVPGIVRKQFTARDIISKWDVIEVYGNTTASLAAKFLDSLILRCPFKIKAIQVDGGSEFKAEFEQECQKRNIKLFVLPPYSPKLNGCVERANRTHTEEFYEVNDFSLNLEELNQQLREWENIYNTVRPHKSLGYLTPQEYVNICKNKERNVYGMY